MASDQPSPPLQTSFQKAVLNDRRPPCRTSTVPISLRMTFAEKARLDRDAAGMSLSAYIRWRLFDPASPPPKSRGKFPVKDQQALTQLLALLGQTRLANNLNQIARSANSGSLLIDEDTERLIVEARDEVADMRRILMGALGLDA